MNKIRNKKGLDAPSNMMVIVMFIAILAILIVLALFFRGQIEGSGRFQYVTNFFERLGGGW